MNTIYVSKAIDDFNSGKNCSQAVLGSLSERVGIPYEMAIGIANGFGGGMARQQLTCGAVTGAYMLLGAAYHKKYPQDPDKSKTATYQAILAFNKQLLKEHVSLNCKDLLQCNLQTEEGQAYFKEHHLFESVCHTLVKDAVRISASMIDEIEAG